MATPPPKDRMRALKLRGKVKVGATLKPEEAAWLHDYETAQEARAGARGASRAHSVRYEEETREAVGTGTAAEIAAAAALAREEGRRYDHLLDGAMKSMQAANTALMEACRMHREMCATLLERAKEDGQTVRELTVSVRTHFLAATELEADAIRAAAEKESEDNGVDKMIAEGLVKKFLPGTASTKK